MSRLPGARWRWMWMALALFLGPDPAWADVPSEVRYVRREEIPDEVRRRTIGVVSLSFLLPPAAKKELLLPVYAEVARAPKGTQAPKPQRHVPVGQTLAWSGWDFDSQALRRFPVLRKQGAYVEVVLNARTGERGWLRVGEAPETPSSLAHKVEYVAFDRSLEGKIIDPFFFGEPWLYSRPDEEAPRRRIAHGAPPEGISESGWIEVRKVRGTFVQVAPTVGMDEEPAPPAGWLRLRDGEGRLLLWLDTHPGC